LSCSCARKSTSAVFLSSGSPRTRASARSGSRACAGSRPSAIGRRSSVRCGPARRCRSRRSCGRPGSRTGRHQLAGLVLLRDLHVDLVRRAGVAPR
jgi:hypothetical protein